MPSEGYNDASTATENCSLGEATWTNIANSIDNNLTTASTSAPGTATYTCKNMITNFGFSISGTPTIQGVECRMAASASATNRIHGYAQLVIAGVATGTEKQWSNVPSVYGDDWNNTFGGASDLWGTTPTVAQVNASNFGVQCRFQNYTGTGAVTVSLYEVQLKVYYSGGHSLFYVLGTLRR